MTQVHRCKRCGIESSEPTCFAIPQKHAKGPRDIRCVMCERAHATSTKRAIWQLLVATLIPPLILIGLHKGDVHVTLPVILVALLIYPAAIVAHELGHALVAWLLGLEIGTITIGSGPAVWRFELGSVPVHVHAWPLSGFVLLGAATKTMLRTRVWLTVLAGPLLNAGLVVVTISCWHALQPAFGGELLGLWLIANFTLFASSILPHSSSLNGQPYDSDGLQLWKIPGASKEDMDLYLVSALLMRGFSLFEAGDYARSKAVAERLLARAPDNRFARIMISANTSNLGEYAETLDVLNPLLHSIDALNAPVRAVVGNNAAYSLAMSAARARPPDECALQKAEQLSADAFAAYPCVLAYRSTRALVLAVRGYASEALELLKYRHYERGSSVERGQREVVRAFALHTVGKIEEAKAAAKAAIKLNPIMGHVLNTLMTAQTSVGH